MSILDSAVQDDEAMQDFESESLLMGGDHSQKGKTPPIKKVYGSKDCVDLSSSSDESRIIKVFPSGPYSTNAYVVACAQTGEAAILDPAPNSSLDIQDYLTLHQLKPKKILLTHSHWDHIADVGKLKEHYSIPVYVHPLDAPNLQQPGADGLPNRLDIPGVQPDFFLDEGTPVPVGHLLFDVLHTPGHSAGCVCFYEPQNHLLFSGDTLFKGTYGNISFPTSRPNLMISSLERLAQLPPETRVFPGHGPETTIANESSWIKNLSNDI